MSVEAALLAGRRAAESRMTSTARVRRVDPSNPLTNEDGFEVDGWIEVYAGRFRLGGSQNVGASRTVNIGDVEVALAVRVAHFPADTTGLEDGDLIEVTSGESAGMWLRVVEASFQDQATARRVPVVEARKPEGWE